MRAREAPGGWMMQMSMLGVGPTFLTKGRGACCCLAHVWTTIGLPPETSNVPLLIRRLAFSTAMLAFVAGAPSEVHAQMNGDSVSEAVRIRNSCRLASHVFTTGHPANKREWASNWIFRCGPVGGQAIAHVIRARRSVEGWNSELDDIANLATHLVDRSIFFAAKDIATDESAGRVARTQAFRVLAAQIDPSRPMTYAEITTDPLPWVMDIDYSPDRGEPLPYDACEMMETLGQAVFENKSSHRELRTAAYNTWVLASGCVRHRS
jgi:hypothetical protein